MKGKSSLLALILGIIVPSIVLGFVKGPVPGKDQNIDSLETTVETKVLTGGESRTVSVLQEDGSFTEMDLESYLIGVLLCEMPVDFDIEALKAQAVVARTYTLRRCLVVDKHDDNAVCTSPECCQGYIDPATYTDEQLQKIEEAVYATTNQVLLYDGALIEATYFSCSGGMTEDAKAVWGEDIPYLQARESPGEEKADHYSDSVRYSVDEFQNRLGISAVGPAESLVQNITYTQGGGVDRMTIGGTDFTGVQLRKMLDLRSTAMIITAIGDTVTITTKGFGHRVGMSQYGAEAMALNGDSYEQILAHYYSGAELTEFNGFD